MPITKSHTPPELKLLHNSLLSDDPALYIELLNTKPSIFGTKNNSNPFALVIEKNKENILKALLEPSLFETLRKQFSFNDAPFIHALTYCNYATISLIAQHFSPADILEIKKTANSKIVKQKIAVLLAHSDMPTLISELNKDPEMNAIRENLLPLSINAGDYVLFNKLMKNKEALNIKLSKFDIENYYANTPALNSLFNKQAFNTADSTIAAENKLLTQPIAITHERFNVFYIINTVINHPKTIYDVASTEHMKRSLSLIERINNKNSLKAQLASSFKTVYFVAKETNSFNSELFNESEVNTLEGLLDDSSVTLLPTLFSFDFMEPLLFELLAQRDTSTDKFINYCITYLTLALSDLNSVDVENNLLGELANLNTYSSKTKQMMLILSILKHGTEVTISNINHVSLVRELFKLGYEPFDVMLHAKNNRITKEAVKNLT